MYTVSWKAARVNKGISLNEAAKAIGVSKVSILKYESYEVIPKFDRVAAMCKLYEVPLELVRVTK